ncbi:MAG: DNA primase [Microthrixaceae bacterium]|nr:DNA primase [Microthrixaceae bacterium]
MGIVDEDIVRVRESTDIVALISQYVPLRRVGQRWTGLCPFHNEKTPSFSVDATSGLYHCFGCKASGDAITFVREKEQTDFVGAIEFLANRVGITLRYTDANEGESRKRQAKLYGELERAADWYHERLKSGVDAAAARKYLRSRGFTKEEVEHFKVGWAPDDWDQLMRHLRISEADAVASGLGFVNRAGRMQDFFRARILFPILDDRSRVIGFGGRKLPDAEGAKYKNSRDNDVYHKSRALYGLNWAKTQAVERNEMIVCEGYTDVIGFNRADITRAVATCGTALTEDHVKLIKRFANRLVLAYDADEAGQSAAERVYAWERAHDIEVAVVQLPDGLDPDELASSDPDALNEAVENARPFLRFRVDRVLADSNLSSAEGRSKTAERALEVIAEHPEPFVRDQYVMQLADLCRIDVELLRSRLADSSRRTKQNADRKGSPDRRGGSSPGYASDDGDPGPWSVDNGSYGDPGGYDDSGSYEPPGDYGYSGGQSSGGRRRSQRVAPGGGRSSKRVNERSPSLAVELEALRLFLVNRPSIEGYLVPEMFDDALVRSTFELLESNADVVSARDRGTPEEAELLARLAVDPSEAEVNDVLIRLATEVGRSVLADLEARARSSADPLAFVEVITWLKLEVDDLRRSKVEVEKLDQLLVWLRDQRRESDRG